MSQRSIIARFSKFPKSSPNCSARNPLLFFSQSARISPYSQTSSRPVRPLEGEGGAALLLDYPSVFSRVALRTSLPTSTRRILATHTFSRSRQRFSTVRRRSSSCLPLVLSHDWSCPPKQRKRPPQSESRTR